MLLQVEYSYANNHLPMYIFPLTNALLHALHCFLQQMLQFTLNRSPVHRGYAHTAETDLNSLSHSHLWTIGVHTEMDVANLESNRGPSCCTKQNFHGSLSRLALSELHTELYSTAKVWTCSNRRRLQRLVVPSVCDRLPALSLTASFCLPPAPVHVDLHLRVLKGLCSWYTSSFLKSQKAIPFSSISSSLTVNQHFKSERVLSWRGLGFFFMLNPIKHVGCCSELQSLDTLLSISKHEQLVCGCSLLSALTQGLTTVLNVKTQTLLRLCYFRPC